MAIYVGIDVGTQGTRALAISEQGEVIGVGNGSHELHTPHPGWTEQNPEEWWTATCTAVQELSSKIDSSAIRGIGMTGQMHGSVFLDKSATVIRPALLWNDQRTDKETNWMDQVARQELLDIAFNPAITGFQAPKIVWLRNNEPKHYERIRSVLLPKDYIRLKLTGEMATDVADASGTLLLDVAGRQWSPVLLEKFGIDPTWMPPVYEGPQLTGKVLPDVARVLGIPKDIPVAAGGGDNSAAAIGTGIIESGVISSSIGTSGVVFAHTENPIPDPFGRLHTMCHSVPNAYHYMGVILSAGMSLQWLRNLLNESSGESGVGKNHSYEGLTESAAKAPVGSEGLIFLPYLTGERSPHLDPAIRAGFVGLNVRHGLRHISRAVMEGVTFAMRDSLELMKHLGLPLDRIVATGGGARSHLWRQMQADVYGLPVFQSKSEEGPAYGAALLGGVVAGDFKSITESVGACVDHVDPVYPESAQCRSYEEYYQVYRDLYSGLRDPMHTLTKMVLEEEH